MHLQSVNLLKLMFLPGETVCLSHNKYGYHSFPLENAFQGKVTLVPPDPNRAFERPDSSELIFAALNPIKGFRLDANCTAYRNFLIEMDVGPLKEQLNYIRQIGMPYSACVFSGGKSLHFLISLDTDLPSEKVYRIFSRWILAVAALSDQNCQNPSRSIRLPGALREPGKWQRLVEMKEKVKLEDLVAWLNKFPECKPETETRRMPSEKREFHKLSWWAKNQLAKGLKPTKGRNALWFALGCEFALAGYNEDDTLDILRDYYVSDHDFKEREWKASVKSGFKHIYDRNG